MTAREYKQAAYILHTRPFKETSLLVDALTKHHGRIKAIVRGVRGKKSQHQGLLQPFVPLLLSWSGKSDLFYLSAVEQRAPYPVLTGRALFCAFYANELLMRMLMCHVASEQLFACYDQLLAMLCAGNDRAVALRIFEKNLLQALGYGLVFNKDCRSGEAVIAQACYWFEPQQGVYRIFAQKIEGMPANQISGVSLLALDSDTLYDDDIKRDARRIMRLALRPYLGNKPLKSRELWLGVNNAKRKTIC